MSLPYWHLLWGPLVFTCGLNPITKIRPLQETLKVANMDVNPCVVIGIRIRLNLKGCVKQYCVLIVIRIHSNFIQLPVLVISLFKFKWRAYHRISQEAMYIDMGESGCQLSITHT